MYLTNTAFNPFDPLQSAIVELLLRQPSLTVNDLLEDLKVSYGFKYTRQHLYKVVGKMIDLGMLHKARGKLGVDMRWATKVYAIFSNAVFEMPKREGFAIDVDMKEGQSREFIADSLQSMNSLWDSVSIRLLDMFGGHGYNYMSHSYFNLLNLSACEDFYKYLQDKGVKYWILIGSDTVLDRYAATLYNQMSNHKCAINTTMPFDHNGYVLEVIGDYIAELKIPPNVEMHFKFMFENIDTIEKFDQQLFTDIFKIKAPFKFVITRNRQDAEKLRYAIRSVL